MKRKFFIVTTIPNSLVFFEGQYELLNKIYDVTAISSQKEKLKEFGNSRHLNTHFIHMEREISILTDFIGLISFIKYFKSEKPYIVHGNTPKGSLLSMLAAWLTNVPVRIYMCHGLRYQGCTGLKRKLLMVMEWISCHCATKVMTVSKGVADVLLSDGISNKKPIIIWNGSVSGLNIEKFNPANFGDHETLREQWGLTADNFVLTFVGRIVRDKGINELVNAFSVLSKKYSNMRLLLIGRIEDLGNPISNESKEEIEGNPAIIATGPQYNVPEFLSISDLFVFPSYREGFGLSVMEAGAMGVPAISTDIIGCNEVIEDGKTGLLIPAHSSDAIVHAVEKLYNNKELFNSIKSNCRLSVVERYEQKTLWKKYLDFYKNL